MLRLQALYNPRNIDRVRYAQIGISFIALSLSAYLGFTAFESMRGMWGAQTMLNKHRLQTGRVVRQTEALRRTLAREPRSSDGGVDGFTLALSGWAGKNGVKIDAVAPQGDMHASDVKADGVSLGQWNSCQVQVQGHGPFAGVLSLMNKLRGPGIPAELESFALDSGGGTGDDVQFGLTLTVYEKKES